MKQTILLLFFMILIPMCSGLESSTSSWIEQDILEVQSIGYLDVGLSAENLPNEMSITSDDLKWNSAMVTGGVSFDSSTGIQSSPTNIKDDIEHYKLDLFVMISLLTSIIILTFFALRFIMILFIKNMNEEDKRRMGSDGGDGTYYSEYEVQRLIGDKDRQIHAVQMENEQNKQKLLKIYEKIENAPPEVRGFIYGRDYGSYDASEINQKIESLKKNWSRYKSTHAVEAFQPVFITLDKIARGEDAYFYEGRPYYSVDKIVDCFGEMLNRIKGYEYLWKALEWLKKTYG